MINMNNCQICGNLVRDPEIKTTSSGKAVATMTVAVNRYFVNPNGDKQEFTDYVRVKAWPPWAEAIGNQLQKGCRCLSKGGTAVTLTARTAIKIHDGDCR